MAKKSGKSSISRDISVRQALADIGRDNLPNYRGFRTGPADRYMFLRLARIIGVNHETNTCTITWVDQPGTRDLVPISHPYYGFRGHIMAVPEINTVCIVGFLHSIRPFILAYLPVNHPLMVEMTQFPERIEDTNFGVEQFIKTHVELHEDYDVTSLTSEAIRLLRDLEIQARISATRLEEFAISKPLIEPGEIDIASYQGSEIRWDQDLTMTDMNADEIRLQSEDNSIHYTSMHSIRNTEWGKTIEGHVRRPFPILSDNKKSDPLLRGSESKPNALDAVVDPLLDRLWLPIGARGKIGVADQDVKKGEFETIYQHKINQQVPLVEKLVTVNEFSDNTLALLNEGNLVPIPKEEQFKVRKLRIERAEAKDEKGTKTGIVQFNITPDEVNVEFVKDINPFRPIENQYTTSRQEKNSSEEPFRKDSLFSRLHQLLGLNKSVFSQLYQDITEAPGMRTLNSLKQERKKLQEELKGEREEDTISAKGKFDAGKSRLQDRLIALREKLKTRVAGQQLGFLSDDKIINEAFPGKEEAMKQVVPPIGPLFRFNTGTLVDGDDRLIKDSHSFEKISMQMRHQSGAFMNLDRRGSLNINLANLLINTAGMSFKSGFVHRTICETKIVDKYAKKGTGDTPGKPNQKIYLPEPIPVDTPSNAGKILNIDPTENPVGSDPRNRKKTEPEKGPEVFNYWRTNTQQIPGPHSIPPPEQSSLQNSEGKSKKSKDADKKGKENRENGEKGAAATNNASKTSSDATKEAGDAAQGAGEKGKNVVDKVQQGASAAEQSDAVAQVEKEADKAARAATKADTASRSVNQIAESATGAGAGISGQAKATASSAQASSDSAAGAAQAAQEAATAAQGLVDGIVSQAEALAIFGEAISAGKKAASDAALTDEEIKKLAEALSVSPEALMLPDVATIDFRNFQPRLHSRSSDHTPVPANTGSTSSSSGSGSSSSGGNAGSDSNSRGKEGKKENEPLKLLNEWQWKIPKEAKVKPRNDIIDPSIIGFDIPRTKETDWYSFQVDKKIQKELNKELAAELAESEQMDRDEAYVEITAANLVDRDGTIIRDSMTHKAIVFDLSLNTESGSATRVLDEEANLDETYNNVYQRFNSGFTEFGMAYSIEKKKEEVLVKKEVKDKGNKESGSSSEKQDECREEKTKRDAYEKKLYKDYGLYTVQVNARSEVGVKSEPKTPKEIEKLPKHKKVEERELRAPKENLPTDPDVEMNLGGVVDNNHTEAVKEAIGFVNMHLHYRVKKQIKTQVSEEVKEAIEEISSDIESGGDGSAGIAKLAEIASEATEEERKAIATALDKSLVQGGAAPKADDEPDPAHVDPSLEETTGNEGATGTTQDNNDETIELLKSVNREIESNFEAIQKTREARKRYEKKKLTLEAIKNKILGASEEDLESPEQFKAAIISAGTSSATSATSRQAFPATPADGDENLPVLTPEDPNAACGENSLFENCRSFDPSRKVLDEVSLNEAPAGIPFPQGVFNNPGADVQQDTAFIQPSEENTPAVDTRAVEPTTLGRDSRFPSGAVLGPTGNIFLGQGAFPPGSYFDPLTGLTHTGVAFGGDGASLGVNGELVRSINQGSNFLKINYYGVLSRGSLPAPTGAAIGSKGVYESMPNPGEVGNPNDNPRMFFSRLGTATRSIEGLRPRRENYSGRSLSSTPVPANTGATTAPNGSPNPSVAQTPANQDAFSRGPESGSGDGAANLPNRTTSVEIDEDGNWATKSGEPYVNMTIINPQAQLQLGRVIHKDSSNQITNAESHFGRFVQARLSVSNGAGIDIDEAGNTVEHATHNFFKRAGNKGEISVEQDLDIHSNAGTIRMQAHRRHEGHVGPLGRPAAELTLGSLEVRGGLDDGRPVKSFSGNNVDIALIKHLPDGKCKTAGMDEAGHFILDTNIPGVQDRITMPEATFALGRVTDNSGDTPVDMRSEQDGNVQVFLSNAAGADLRVDDKAGVYLETPTDIKISTKLQEDLESETPFTLSMFMGVKKLAPDPKAENNLLADNIVTTNPSGQNVLSAFGGRVHYSLSHVNTVTGGIREMSIDEFGNFTLDSSSLTDENDNSTFFFNRNTWMQIGRVVDLDESLPPQAIDVQNKFNQPMSFRVQRFLESAIPDEKITTSLNIDNAGNFCVDLQDEDSDIAFVTTSGSMQLGKVVDFDPLATAQGIFDEDLYYRVQKETAANEFSSLQIDEEGNVAAHTQNDDASVLLKAADAALQIGKVREVDSGNTIVQSSYEQDAKVHVKHESSAAGLTSLVMDDEGNTEVSIANEDAAFAIRTPAGDIQLGKVASLDIAGVPNTIGFFGKQVAFQIKMDSGMRFEIDEDGNVLLQTPGKIEIYSTNSDVNITAAENVNIVAKQFNVNSSDETNIDGGDIKHNGTTINVP